MYFEMKHEGLNLKGYLKSLVTMGAGLPLKAITSNTIKVLNLSGQKLLPAQVALLAKALEHNTSLSYVDLSYCEIDNEGMEHLSLALTKHTTLEGLNLKENQISDEGMKHLSPGLSKNTTLKRLFLDDNQISDVGMKHLSLGLTKNTTLTYLVLGSNQISDVGMKHLSLTLTKNTTLEELILSDNQISDEGMKQIETALFRNKFENVIGTITSNRIEKLNLHGQKLLPAQVKSVAEGVGTQYIIEKGLFEL